METTALLTRPLAAPDRAGASGRITPRQNFRALNLLLVVTPQRSPNAGSRSVSGVAWAVLIRTVCADSARVACALFSLPAPDQRKCRRRTTGLLKRSAHRLRRSVEPEGCRGWWPHSFLSDLYRVAYGTNRTHRAGLMMSVVRRRPEVAGRRSNSALSSIRSVMPQSDQAARPDEPDRGQTKFR